MERVVVNFLLNGIEQNANDIAKLARSLRKVNKNVLLIGLSSAVSVYLLDKENQKLRKEITDLKRRQDYAEVVLTRVECNTNSQPDVIEGEPENLD